MRNYEILVTLMQILINMKTTSVALGPHFEDFIQLSILSGRYNNASEVVRSGLRLLEMEEQKLVALRSAIQEGIDSGIADDFDPDTYLNTMKSRKNGKI